MKNQWIGQDDEVAKSGVVQDEEMDQSWPGFQAWQPKREKDIWARG